MLVSTATKCQGSNDTSPSICFHTDTMSRSHDTSPIDSFYSDIMSHISCRSYRLYSNVATDHQLLFLLSRLWLWRAQWLTLRFKSIAWNKQNMKYSNQIQFLAKCDSILKSVDENYFFRGCPGEKILMTRDLYQDVLNPGEIN